MLQIANKEAMAFCHSLLICDHTHHNKYPY